MIYNKLIIILMSCTLYVFKRKTKVAASLVNTKFNDYANEIRGNEYLDLRTVIRPIIF